MADGERIELDRGAIGEAVGVMFLRNLVTFMMGIACQVMAALLPDLASALAPAGALLLSAANVAKVLNGSFWKHAVTFALGVTCQVTAVVLQHRLGARADGAAGALLAAGGLLASASDLARILSGIRTPAGTPDAPTQSPPLKP